MRNFRTAAVAAATAASVAFAGTSVAFAADNNSEETSLSSELSSANEKVKEDDSDATLSSKWGDATGADKKVAGADLLGENTADDTTNQTWAKAWREGTYAAIGTAIAGALFAAYNFAVYNHIVPAHVLDPFFRR
ncbi:hypothetical protein ACUY2X_09785 [Corynebacterium minutissimum]|uniref:hypothetical protein n=1 Tax=unclassified Corynebacterium TaxID=2624378 RepID=UPI0008A33AAE|nr:MULTISPECIES: hypothetical protein [unclassified Corynebacterium]MDK8764327.1 hypothetical protein [Corynebacterium sp. MSK218]OFR66514.1 hypothetical protein HMPREF2875_08875 [Corynebacterium sp. HMSC078H07]